MKTIHIKRHEKNPIVYPSELYWRSGVTFNPGVEKGPDGKVYMLERAATLQPFESVFGLLESDDGVNFTPIGDEPILRAADFGHPRGNIQDPRLTYIDGQFVMTFVIYETMQNLIPRGSSVKTHYNPIISNVEPEQVNTSRTGIAVSTDMREWTFKGWVGPRFHDDKDNVLFPEKINGKYALITRPTYQFGEGLPCDCPSMWIRYSEDLVNWSEAEFLATRADNEWEKMKIGGSAPPIKTDRGWLVTYHGVDMSRAYRIGIMMLDLEDPTKILARTPEPIMVPEYYYEKCGIVIPNTIFISANIVMGEDLYLYYGACDTVIALATVNLNELVDFVMDS